MKNYYRTLGVSRNASMETLKSVIDTHPDRAVAEKASYILLEKDRRDAYDQHHEVLSRIGAMRSRFGLSNTGTWSDGRYQEFKIKHAPVNDVPPAGYYTHHVSTAVNEGARRSHTLRNVVIAIIAGLTLIIWHGASRDDGQDVQVVGNQSYQPEQTTQNDGYDSNSSEPDNSESSYAPPPPSWYDLHPEKDLPRNGKVWYKGRGRVAPFKINTLENSEHTYIILADYETEQEVLAVFVRGGKTVTVKVPLGTYRMYYTTGERWYGREHLFGPDRDYQVADKLFEFTSTYNGYMGNEVTLYAVYNGNMHTSDVSPEEVNRIRNTDE
jgi:curved DNA-binding protein CbpA